MVTVEWEEATKKRREPEEPRTIHCAMLWPLLLFLLCAGSLAQDLEFQLVAPESVTVEEGLCVHVPCSVFYPSIKLTLGPVTGSWLRKGVSLHEDSPVATSDPRQLVQKATQGRFQLLGDPQKHDCSLLIRDAQKNDTGMYFFRVVREPFVRYSYKKSQLSLHVTWKSGQMRELVLVAVGEATVKLLILGLCLAFLIVMFCRRKTTKLSVHMGCENPIKAHQQDSKVHSNPENPRPLQKDSPQEQSSVHTKISLDFMGGKPQEYSEI